MAAAGSVFLTGVAFNDEEETTYSSPMRYDMELTIEQAKSLSVGTVLLWTGGRNADGTFQRWKVNGQPKTWKRSPDRVRVPLKRGLYQYAYLDEANLHEFLLVENPHAVR
jgi:hypothetical protein